VDFLLVAVYCIVVGIATVVRHALPELWRHAHTSSANGLGPILAGAISCASLALLGLMIIGLPLSLRPCAVSRLLKLLRSSRSSTSEELPDRPYSRDPSLERWAFRAHARAIVGASGGGFDTEFFVSKLKRTRSANCCVSFLPRPVEALLKVGDNSEVLKSEHELLGRYGPKEAISEVHVVSLLFGGFLVFAGAMGIPRNGVGVGLVECTIAILLGSVFVWRWLQAARLTPIDWNDVIAAPGEVAIVGPLRTREFRAANTVPILYGASLNRVFVRMVETTGRHASFSLDFEATRRFLVLWMTGDARSIEWRPSPASEMH